MTDIKTSHATMQEATQVLVFRHSEGTVETNEHTNDTVVTEMAEETGLTTFKADRLLSEDKWRNGDGAIRHRHFYKMWLKRRTAACTTLSVSGRKTS